MKLRSPLLTGLFLLGLLAGCSRPPAQATQLSFPADLPPILLWLPEGDQVQQLEPQNGNLQEQVYRQVASVAQVLSQPHLRLRSQLIDNTGAYFALPNGLVAPDGAWLIDLTQGTLHLRRVDGMAERQVAAGAAHPLWSPDSQQLVYTDATGVHRYSLSDETAVTPAWQLTVIDQMRGAALTSFGIAPLFAPDQEAVAVKLRLRYTGDGSPFACVDSRTFTGLEDTAVVQPPYQLVLPLNYVGRLCLLPGGLWEGWLLLAVTPNGAEVAPATFGFQLESAEPGERRYFVVTAVP